MAAVSVGTSATTILAPGGSSERDGQVIIYNNGAADVFVGATDAVTTSTGVPIAAGGNLALQLPPGRPVYGIVASGTEEVRVEVF